jgi:hypothetical protein
MPNVSKPLVYVSYAWRDRDAQDQPDQETSHVVDRKQIVDELCAMLEEEDQILVGRDKKLVKTGDSIEDFAGEIAKSGLILAVISKKSLRSKWCMKDEMLQAFRRRNYRTIEFGLDVLPLILDDAEADFEDETSLIDFWSERIDKERKKLEGVDPQRKFSPESWRDLDEMEELQGRLLDLLRVFKNRSMPRGAVAIREEGFHKIRQLVLQRLQHKSESPVSSSIASLPTPGETSNIRKKIPCDSVALVLTPSGGNQELRYEWKAFIQKSGGNDFELIPNGTIDGSLPMYSRASLEKLFKCVARWIGSNLRDVPLIEIYAPAELLDEDWGSMNVHNDSTDDDDDKDRAPLHSYYPYLLRSSDRLLNSDWNARRGALGRMHNSLIAGDGVWLPSNQLAKKHIVETLDGFSCPKAGGVISAIRCLQSTTIPERNSWLRLILRSMAPLVIWPSRPRHGFLDQELAQEEVQSLLDELPLVLDDRPHCPDLLQLARARLEKARDDNNYPCSKIDLSLSILVDHPEHCPDPELLQTLFHPSRQDPNSASESSSPSVQIHIST